MHTCIVANTLNAYALSIAYVKINFFSNLKMFQMCITNTACDLFRKMEDIYKNMNKKILI